MASRTGEKESTKNKHILWTCEIKDEIEGEDKDTTYGWVCSNAPLDDNASRYFFEVRRYKITDTKEEYLKVQVFLAKLDRIGEDELNYDECAEIEKVSIIDLESRLLNLRIYGVMLERKHFPKIRQAIEKAYLEMTARPDNDSIGTTVTDVVISKVYGLFARYIKEESIEADEKGELYNIPVNEFKDYLLDSKYGGYKYSEIRSRLAQFTVDINGKPVNGTRCSFGRNDNTIVRDGKRIKVISFEKKVVDSYQITGLPEG